MENDQAQFQLSAQSEKNPARRHLTKPAKEIAAGMFTEAVDTSKGDLAQVRQKALASAREATEKLADHRAVIRRALHEQWKEKQAKPSADKEGFRQAYKQALQQSQEANDLKAIRSLHRSVDQRARLKLSEKNITPQDIEAVRQEFITKGKRVPSEAFLTTLAA